jgi:uncharacterized protein (AIM24 family)
MVFGGEGMFNTKVTGPGRIVLQTMSISIFAEMLSPLIKTDRGNK